MIRSVYTTIIITVLMVSCTTGQPKDEFKVNNISDARLATVLIDNIKQGGRGTGFHIGGGYFLTAQHVIAKGGTSILVNTIRARVIAEDKHKDIALLYCKAFSRTKAFKLAKNPTKVLDKVIALGWHYGQEFNASTGFCSKAVPHSIHLFSTAPINSGCSGGPVLNTDLEVVGINVLLYTRTGDYSGVSVHLKVEEVRKFLQGVRAK